MTQNTFLKKHPRLTTFILILLIVLSTDFVVANIYYKLTGETIYNKIMNPAISIEKKYRINSDFYHHDLKKNIKNPAIWGPMRYEMITNSLGFRDKENRTVALKGNKYPVLFIGDSFVEGTGTAYPKTFIGILDSKYSNKIEILNAGVVSYAPTIYYKKTKFLIENVGLEFDELVVFIDISDINDEIETYKNDNKIEKHEKNIEGKKPVGGNLESTIKGYSRKNSFIYGLPRLAKALKVKSTHPSADPNINTIINHRKALWTINKDAYNEYGQAGLEKAKKNMSKLYNLLVENNIKLTVVVHPWPTQIYYNDINSIQVKEWKTWCLAHDTDFINLFPVFISGDNEKNKTSIIEYYIKNDMHWNEKGQKKVANILQLKLEKIFHKTSLQN